MLDKILKSPLIAFALFTTFATVTECAAWSKISDIGSGTDRNMVTMFLIVFPLLLTFLFFLTLWLKPKSFVGAAEPIHAPSKTGIQ